MLWTFEVSHAVISPLKLSADAKTPIMFVTELVFHSFKSWSNELAPAKAHSIFETLEVSQFPIFWLNEFAWSKIAPISSTLEVSQ